MSEKLSERSEMSDVAFASSLVRGVVPADAGATVGKRIWATARRLGWRHSRTRDVWYGAARRIDAHEMDQLRAAQRAKEIAEARDEHREIRARIARLETALAVAHPTLDRAEIDVVRREMRGPEPMDRA